MDTSNLPGIVAGFAPERNVRELGGLVARDGHRVRLGMLLRGSTLDNLSDEERSAVDALDLRFILDLRAKQEAAAHPEYIPEDATYQRVAGMYDLDGAEMDFSPAAIAGMSSVGGPESIMRTLYLTMVRDNPALHTLVDLLKSHAAPLYFHCSAGKDRTGVATALILSILGVADDVILENFLITNVYRAETINNPPDPLPEKFPTKEMWMLVNSVHASDLKAVLAAMGEQGHPREQFLQTEYDLTPTELAGIRSFYLE